MAELEKLTAGSLVDGIVPNQSVKIIAVSWHGSNVAEVFYQLHNGKSESRLLFRENETDLTVRDNRLPWNFDVDGDKVRLVSEAYRIHLAHIFDPYLAVHTSAIEPLPHQISAVYETMLQRMMPLRYVLADDPGAGKTIMTGLFLKELQARGELSRCLIVCPGSLAQQWQDELFLKFHLKFEIITNDRIENAASRNVFAEIPYCIARLDKLSRSEELQEKLKNTDWDLIVCDEAHKMSATMWGGEIKYTKRFLLGRLLSNIAQHFLLLTATPHNGKEEDFQLFMSLIDQDRFEGVGKTKNGARTIDVSDVMRRLVKEELLTFEGKPLFPERRAYTVNYDLSDAEAQLYTAVTRYVEDEFNRAERLNNDRKTTVGFALTILQRRLASSPEAIYQSLNRRLDRLQRRLDEERLGKRAAESKSIFDVSDFDEDDIPADELEISEEELVDKASAASTIQELQAEITTLTRLKKMANAVRQSGEDRKWDELSKLLQENELMRDSDGNREKLIIFTEHRDTLNYLRDKIISLLGTETAVVTIHGGMLRDERQKVQELFRQDKSVRILIATDAAGEGVNLQRAHLMVNYDLPWNPNRLEQRFGRIHRIGQKEVCHLWNLVAKATREGAVFARLFEKLEQERAALGGKVFDVLGKLTFDNKPLRELLVEAIRYGNQPEIRNRLEQVVDESMNADAFRDILRRYALTDDVMTAETVFAIRDEMVRAEAHRLQPHFIESFFIQAFTQFGGKIIPRSAGCYEITQVPFKVRNRDTQIGYGQPVVKTYERVCFDKAFATGRPSAELICPGHPLMEAVTDLVLEEQADVLKRGGVFVDDNDLGTQPRLLFYIESALTDGKTLKNGNRRVVSKRVNFVEIRPDGTADNAGYAPYLDYRSITDAEKQILEQYVQKQEWLMSGIEERAKSFVIENLTFKHLNDVKAHKIARIEKTEKAVRDRLTRAIQYWDYRAAELREKESAGKANAKLNAQQAQKRADELAARLEKRLTDLALEKNIAADPPVVVSANLIVPAGLLNQLTGKNPDAFARDTKAVELAAMNAVMTREQNLGNNPVDVSAKNRGYDIESRAPNGTLRLIEVKGRVKGAKTVTVTKNEILTALNSPENFILAVVEIDGNKADAVYLKSPFRQQPEFCATSVNFDIKELFADSVKIED